MKHPAIPSRIARGLAIALRATPDAIAAREDRYNRRPPARRPATRGTSPVRRTLFHAPSFSAGVVMGAIVVLGAAYLPEMLGGPAREPGPAMATDQRPKLTFEFDHLLRNNEVAADPEPYVSPPRVRSTPAEVAQAARPDELAVPVDPAPFALVEPAPPAVAQVAAPAAFPPAQVEAAPPAVRETDPPAQRETFTLQAASFRSRDDADRLRATLLLLDLPATTTISSLPSGVWYRVTVGPFEDRGQAEQAMTRLRENNISAIWSRS
jgi:cell division septation protein DedD